MKKYIYSLVGAFIIYLLFGFVEANFDFRQWETLTRSLCAFLMPIVSLMIFAFFKIEES